MINWIAGSVPHSLIFIGSCWATSLGVFAFFRSIHGSNMTMDETVEYMNAHRDGRTGKDVLEDRLVEAINAQDQLNANQDPEMATRLAVVDDSPDWMTKG